MNPITRLTLPALALCGAAAAQSRPHFLTPTQMPAPINVAGASSYSMALSADGLRAMVETDRPGGRGGRDIFLLQRPTVQSSFTSYGPMGFCGEHDEAGANLFFEPNGPLSFSSNRAGGAGGHDLYATNGITIVGSPTGLNSPWDDTDPALTTDGLEFFFTSNRPGSLGGKSIWHSSRASVNDAWGSPVALTGIDSANHEQSPSISDDLLWIFFSSNRSGNYDIYAASRSSRQAPFGAPARVAELSGPNHDIGIEFTALDAQALVTVMVNGRAVILSADRAFTQQGTGLSASTTVAPGQVLSAHLQAPAGQLGIVLLGAPMAPVDVGFGLLQLDPRAGMVVLDAVIHTDDQPRLVQMLLPEGQHLRGLPIALQALTGVAPQLRLSNAVLRTVE